MTKRENLYADATGNVLDAESDLSETLSECPSCKKETRHERRMRLNRVFRQPTEEIKDEKDKV